MGQKGELFTVVLAQWYLHEKLSPQIEMHAKLKDKEPDTIMMHRNRQY